MALLGCDISTWQDAASTPAVVDFNKMKAAGANYVFIKATQGNFFDQDVKTHWTNSAGILPRGLYHFYDWGYSLQANTDALVNAMNLYPCELPPVMDYESTSGVPAQATAASMCLQFLQAIESRTGKLPMVYTAPYYWYAHGSTNTAFARYPLWIANYEVLKPTVPAPWTNWKFWQYTSKGDGAAFGVESASIDLDYFNGTLDEFNLWAGITPPPPPPPPVPTLEDRVLRLETNALETERRLKALEALTHSHLNMPIIGK